MKRGSLYTHEDSPSTWYYSIGEVSKRHYLSNAESSNVRFFDTCSNLDQLFIYNFENLYYHFLESLIKQFMPLCYYIELFKTSFKICVKFCLVGMLKRENNEFLVNLFSSSHKYSRIYCSEGFIVQREPSAGLWLLLNLGLSIPALMVLRT